MISVLAEKEGVVSGSRRCLLLGGVHKGGAEPLARLLAHLGVDQTAGYDNFPDRLRALNQSILESAGFDPCAIEPFHAGWYASLRHAEFRTQAIELVRSTYSSASLFVLKDDATSQLLPFWRNVLKACEIEPVALDFYEDPASFAGGLSRATGVGGEAARTVWLARVLESERASRGMVRAQLTQEALLHDWEAALTRLSQGLGVVWPAWSDRVRRAIVGELVQGSDADTPAARKGPHADQLGQWTQAAQDVVWRWAREGEDDRGRARMDELGGLFDEAREFVGSAFATVAQMGLAHRDQSRMTEGLMARIAELQSQSDAMELAAQVQAEEVAALRASLAAIEAERDRLAAVTPADRDELARVEARWAEVFRASRDAAEILTEQNGVFQAAIARLTAEVTELEQSLHGAKADLERLRLVEISQKAEVSAARAETAAARAEVAEVRKSQDDMRRAQDDIRRSQDEMRKTVAEARDRVARLRHEAGLREATIEDLQNTLLARAAGASPSRGGSFDAVKRNLSPKAMLLHFKPKARRKMLRRRHARHLVSQSGLFDAKFYAARYPDVVAAGADLLDHFIDFGGAEGRHPSLSFDSEWYLDENPDIRGAGLNPLVHYIEHGRDEGRRRRSLVDAETVTAAIAEASAAPTSDPQGSNAPSAVRPPEVTAHASELEGTWMPRAGGWKAMLSPDSARRSAILSLGEIAGQADARAIAIGETIVAAYTDETPRAALDRMALFAALRPGGPAAITIAGEQARAAAPHALLAGPGCGIGLLADGWFDGEAAITLRLSAGFFGVARVFQADGDGRLHCVAEAVVGGGEADLVEAQLVDPFGALLVVFALRDGGLVDSAVVPFPSLMRGGLHHGELAVLETAPGSMATLADYSQTLALEWLGWPEGPERFAIGRIAIDMRGASGTEPVFRSSVLSSVARQFGIVMRAQEGSYAPQREQLVAAIAAVEPAGGMAPREAANGVLVLPCDAVPSIYAMVARRLPHDPSLSRFAVVDAATVRPLADVSLPYDAGLARLQHAEMPAHAPFLALAEAQQAGGGAPIFPLAVRHYGKLAWQADPLFPVSPDQDLPMGHETGADTTITVIIDTARGAEGLTSCLAALENQIGTGALDVVIAGWPDGAPLPSCDLPIRSIDRRELTLAGRLNAAAALSEAARLMFLDPSVLLSDPRTLALLAHVADRPGTASAACALATESQDDTPAKVHSAGYFPTRVSLQGEPVFDFDQVDIARSLPAATFPVVANHAKCMLFDVAVFRDLGGFDAQRFPVAMHDLDLGFRALAAGHTNLCTTLVRAAVDNAAPGADFPDPLAHRSVRPADWQSLFDRVTVVRELRR